MEGLAGSTPNMNWDSGDLPTAWKNFKTHVDFMFKGPLITKKEEEMCAYLMIWVGDKGREVYGTWTLTPEEKKSLAALYGKYETFVKPKSNTVFARYKFQQRMQQESESAEQFITELKTLVKDCGYEKSDEMVRDRIVCGTKNVKVKERLLNEGSDLTLEKATDVARSYELNQQQLSTMNSREDPNIHGIRKTKPQKTAGFKQNPGYRQNPTAIRYENKGAKPKYETFKPKFESKSCPRCGYNHTKQQKCPAMGKSCQKCKKRDHFARMCRTQNRDKRVHELNTSDDDYDFDALFVGAIDCSSKKRKRPKSDAFVEKLHIKDEEIQFQLDTGAKCNVLSKTDYRKLKLKDPLQKADVALRSYSGHKIQPEGMITLPLTCNNREHSVQFYIVETRSQSVLSGETSEKIGLIKRINGLEAEYPEVFEGLGCLPGTYHIKIDPNVTPVVQPPKRIPISLKKKVKEELKRMEQIGVITRQIQPTEWVNSIVSVTKSSGNVRVCIDPRPLNDAILREHYPMKTIEEVVAEMPNAKVFSKLDATSGFWQLKLDEESSKLTTFLTPFGRYRFLRAPFGIKSIPEIYQRVMTEMIEDIEGAEVIVDDILVWGATVEEHDERLKRVLEKVKQYNLKLGQEKCQFRQESVDYVGHTITKEGLKTSPEKSRAVREMKKPEDKKELMTFLGFITYLQKFLPHMSEVSAPLRKLLEKDIEWHWERSQEESFEKLKEMASNTPILAFYDPKDKVILNVDASSYGLGAVLLQRDKPVAYASRALNPTQQRYSQIEKETLALVFGCQKFHHYLYGRQFEIESDHRPLEHIFRKSISEAPSRIQRFMMQLQRYDFTVKYKPGKTMYLSDTLSRLNLPETSEEMVPDIDVNQIQLNAHLPMAPHKYEELKQATERDGELQSLKSLIETGWPDLKSDTPVNMREYWTFRDELTCIDGILYKGLKVIIPRALRKEMLLLVHTTHQGIMSCKRRAREFMFWIGMMAEIQQMVEKCEICAKNNKKANHKEPMISSELPDRPSSKVGADLLEYKGQHYLLTIDYYSKWPEVEKLDNLSSENVISYLKKQFARYGYVDELITDNGPQFSSLAFKKFAKDYEFIHTTTSPHYSQAMGQTERYVQTIKNMIKKSPDPSKALLDYRNTPLEGINLSPAQLHIGRRLKSSLPTATELLKPQAVDGTKTNILHKRRQQKQAFYYNKHCGKRLSELNKNQNVMISHNNEMVPGKVVEKHSTPRSYIVETMGGRKLRRNRRHLKPTKASFQPIPSTLAPNDEDRPCENQRYQEIVHDDVGERETTNQSTTSAASNDVSQNTSNFDQPSSNVQTKSGRSVKMPSKYKDFVCNIIDQTRKVII